MRQPGTGGGRYGGCAAGGLHLPAERLRAHAGYWGNKPGVVWPKGYSRDAQFFRSGLTWQEVLDSPVRGDAYFILAHQYIAAVLNIGAGASAPNSLRSIVLAAGTWFATATPGTCVKGARQLQRSWASVLDEYNNGDYPGAPKHCDED